MDKFYHNNHVYVTQAAVVFNKEGKFLTLHRTETAPTHPLTWDLPGGQIEHGEDAYEGIIREVREEAGLEIEDIRPFDVFAKISSNGTYWYTVAYICKAKGELVTLSFEHDQYKWVTLDEFKKLPSWEMIERFVTKANEVV